MVSPDELWQQVHACFDTDDGSLPSIEIANLSEADVTAIYAFLRSRSELVGDPPEFWCNLTESSRPIDSVPNAAELVAAGKAATFHHCISPSKIDGVQIPVLGIFVFADTIEIDYRMGPNWGPREVTALFTLLRECQRLAPDATIRTEGREGPPYSDRLQTAWNAFNALS